MRESNSHQRFWRPLSYHLTNPLFHWKHNDYRWQKSLCIYSTWKGYSQQKLLTKCIFCDKIFCVAKRIFSFDLHMNVCVAQLDRAFGYGPKGRGFESSRTRWFLRSGMLDFQAFPSFFMLRIKALFWIFYCKYMHGYIMVLLQKESL